MAARRATDMRVDEAERMGSGEDLLRAAGSLDEGEPAGGRRRPSSAAPRGWNRRHRRKGPSQREDASACCPLVPQPTTSACPGRPLNVLFSGASCPLSRLVPPPAMTLKTLMDSSRPTGAAIADGRRDLT